MVVGPEEKKQLLLHYQGWNEIKEQRANLNEEMKAVKEGAATLLNIKPEKIEKLFKALKAREENEADEISVLAEILDAIDGSPTI